MREIFPRSFAKTPSFSIVHLVSVYRGSNSDFSSTILEAEACLLGIVWIWRYLEQHNSTSLSVPSNFINLLNRDYFTFSEAHLSCAELALRPWLSEA